MANMYKIMAVPRDWAKHIGKETIRRHNRYINNEAVGTACPKASNFAFGLGLATGWSSAAIKLRGANLMKALLKEDPNDTVGKISYEKNPINYNSTPFSMNKELYSRIQNINTPYSSPSFAGVDYKGPSTQDLFDITYVENYNDVNGNLVIGNFFKVDLKPRSNNTNKCTSKRIHD